MRDRELLELAAKALGVTELTFSSDMECPCNPLPESGNIYWNPLRCDGDALRLAVELGLVIDAEGDCTSAASTSVFAKEMHGNDPYAATRRAIVRAAAEIGRAQ